MNEEVWRSIEKVRWLQTRELANKYPNDADLGAAVRDLIRKTSHEKLRTKNSRAMKRLFKTKQSRRKSH